MAETKTLGLSGFDREEELAFRDLFDRTDVCGWRLVPETEASALLIDIDSMYGQMAWLKGQGGSRPVAALTASPRADTDYLLQRPVNKETLGALLKAMAAGVPTKVASVMPSPRVAADQNANEPSRTSSRAAAEAISMPEPIPEPTPTPEPEPPKHVLFDYLQAGAFPGPVRLADSEPVLALDLASDTYAGGATLKPLALHASASIEPERWQPITAVEYERLKGELGGGQLLNRLRWLAGLCGFDGALCPDLAAATRFKLVKWPQSEREFPKHFRIATALLKQPGSVAELASASGSSAADVVDFINACHAIGMIEAEGMTRGASAKQGLMNRFRGKG